ncbi:ATP-binding protein [Sporomusa malonica]|uniref:Anti-sigma regulatory factor (Ser/Thr protein kinase) n=1 Tax=Sporomusa malonica TaxID=112901 RepID=A0A1W2CFU4_9FIRM|nr:anti-sigma regulatory factor [Sporomusa malonica]SMC83528.1 Anti-sigma regulatory factor (Ser/Thr protein kinase) [Sporomusa malonica]
MLQEHGITLEFILEGGNFDSAGEASSKIKRTLQQLGVRPDIIRRIAISAYEAEMNVIIHAYSGTIRAEIFSERTELSVNDEGPGIPDVELAMREGYSTAPDHIREMGFGAGMGLPNMVRCTDKFDIKTTRGIGTNLSLIIYH